MTIQIRIKRSILTSVPANGTLAFGELAYSNIGGVNRFFIGDANGNTVEIAGDNYLQLDGSGLIPVNKLPILTTANLEDLSIQNVADGQILAYNSTTGTWVNSNALIDTNNSIATLQGLVDANSVGIDSITGSLGQANGIATLDSNGKVTASQLPDSILGGLEYKGVWDADTNTPDLVNGTPEKGDFYKVSVAGSTDLSGITDWKIGDWAVYNGTTWDKIDNTESVSSVNGKTGAVVLKGSDIEVSNTDARTLDVALDSKADKTNAVINESLVIKDVLDVTFVDINSNLGTAVIYSTTDLSTNTEIGEGNIYTRSGANTMAITPTDITKNGVSVLTKEYIGLGNVDNTSDLNKPISTATQTALDLKADLVNGTVPESQLPPIDGGTF